MSVSVHTVNLHIQGIVLIDTAEDGHRITIARHAATGLEGRARTAQEAYEALCVALTTYRRVSTQAGVTVPDGDAAAVL